MAFPSVKQSKAIEIVDALKKIQEGLKELTHAKLMPNLASTITFIVKEKD